MSKAGPQITPINDVYLDVWERKHMHSSKTWEWRNKTKQQNKLNKFNCPRTGPLVF